jgi:peroxiredoxin
MPRRLLPTVLAFSALSAASLFARTLPRPAPDFAVHLTNGKQVLLSQFHGKVVALAFILTYCPHCQKVVGILGKDQAEFGERGFQVLATAIEEGAAKAVPDFLKRFSPSFPLGFDLRPAVLDFLQHPTAEPLMMPQIAFIDRTGAIRAQYGANESFFDESHQEQNIRAKIEELLKQSATASAHR